VAVCVAGVLAVAVMAAVGRPERTSATKDTSARSTTTRSAGGTTPRSPTTAAPTTTPARQSDAAPSDAAPSVPDGTGVADDPFPALIGFGFREPSDAGRYRAIEAGHRHALTAALGVDVPEAQTLEVVAGGKVVGFVFAHPLSEADPAVGDRWVSVELPGSAPGSVAPIGETEVRLAASGKNWVASWWQAPNGFVAVFGNEALLRSFVAEWQGA
jgi:hypothetical protein